MSFQRKWTRNPQKPFIRSTIQSNGVQELKLRRMGGPAPWPKIDLKKKKWRNRSMTLDNDARFPVFTSLCGCNMYDFIIFPASFLAFCVNANVSTPSAFLVSGNSQCLAKNQSFPNDFPQTGRNAHSWILFLFSAGLSLTCINSHLSWHIYSFVYLLLPFRERLVTASSWATPKKAHQGMYFSGPIVEAADSKITWTWKISSCLEKNKTLHWPFSL